MEFHYGLLKDFEKTEANQKVDNLKNFIVEFDFEHIKLANQLKRKIKGLSYVDCLGYIVALKNGVFFVTGDEGFKDLPNVEFIK
jgi:predicted nucleic acid-binding protein